MAKRELAELELASKRGGRRQKQDALNALLEKQGASSSGPGSSSASLYDSLQGQDLVAKCSVGKIPAVEVSCVFKRRKKTSRQK